MDLMTFIPQELIIVTVACSLFGQFLKMSDCVSDRLIPILLMIFSIVFSCAISNSISVNDILLGVICWGVSIGGHQTIKQAKKN